MNARTFKFIYGKNSDVVVRVYGKAAVVTERFDAKLIDDKGKENSFAERYTAIFVKRGSVWQMAAEQSTEIK